jgi:dTDP-glucose 4,6-dehydratase
MDAMLVTGGAGFIGSNFVRYALNHCPDTRVVVLDALTYAGNLTNLDDCGDSDRLRFIQGDIRDPSQVDEAMRGVDTVVNFAAESHVDRSILDPSSFIETNYNGVYVLLEAARRLEVKRFLQVSTDEVYGHVPAGLSAESDPFAPRSPYAASKAAADLLVQSYYTTYGLPVLITRGGNTVGPYQYPEKVLPLFITNALEYKPLPVYGDGSAVRSYLYVEDHCSAIDLVLRSGQPGNAYNVGTDFELNGRDLADRILQILDRPANLREFVPDRSGHDLRYALDCSSIRSLGWSPAFDFDTMLNGTVQWYVDHRPWWQEIRNEDSYRSYYRKQYHER